VQLAGNWRRRRGGARVSDRKMHLIARRIARLDDGRMVEKDDDCARLCNDDVILLNECNASCSCSADTARPKLDVILCDGGSS
jgi:hypothetical protein